MEEILNIDDKEAFGNQKKVMRTVKALKNTLFCLTNSLLAISVFYVCFSVYHYISYLASDEVPSEEPGSITV